MKIYEAIIQRINEICEEQKKSICDISLKGGMSPSNIYALVKGRTRVSKVDTIARFCDGANMTLGQFFSSPLFENLDFED